MFWFSSFTSIKPAMSRNWKQPIIDVELQTPGKGMFAVHLTIKRVC